MRKKRELEKFVRSFADEQWKEIKIEYTLRYKYAISNYGRLIRYSQSFDDGFLMKGGVTAGYRIFGYTIYKNRHRDVVQMPFRKLVAEYFLPKPKENQEYVINIDYNRKNDHVRNLKWVTRQEYLIHRDKFPSVIEQKRRNRNLETKPNGSKLTLSTVKLIKKKLADPNRKTRMLQLAKQFGISESQIYRIKRGTNWRDVTI
jgi:hypothetical protein